MYVQNYSSSIGYVNEKRTKGTNELTDKVLAKIIPCGSRAGIMYGLPKIHKNGAPIRPIISACGTYIYKLAKYLDKILKPLITNNS